MLKRRSYFPLGLEVVVGLLGKMLYRVRALGREHVPATGGAIVIANHLSYADVVVLQLACPRPLRYLGYEEPGSPWYFKIIFRLAGVIPISARRPTAGMRRAFRALAAGELVCLFPEGSISRTGQLQKIRPGFAVMARRTGVPVVPAAIDGLWGSIFSFSGGTYLWKSPRLLPTPVLVAFGRPIPPDRAQPEVARRALLDLGAEAFAERPGLRRHLGREVVRALAKRPGRVALVDRTAERREVTAAQLLAAAAALAGRLRATVPEKRIGIVLPPGAGGAIANLAVLCAGKVPVNLNFTAGGASLEASLRLAGIRTVLTADAMRAKAPDFPWPERTVDLRAELAAAGGKRAMLPWLGAAWLLPNQWFAGLLGLPAAGGDEEAALLFTSGSAGEPKGVVLTHRNLLANCSQISSLNLLPMPCTLAGCLPLFHGFGFNVTLWYPLLRGARLVTVPSPLDTRRLIDAIREEKISTLVGTPTFLRPFLKKARPEELRSLELVVAGAEKLPEELRQGFRAAFQLEIIEGYGLTETAPVSSVNQFDPPVRTATAEPQAGQKAGAVGRLLPGMTARIVDPESGAERALTETGVVWLRGANVFSGYLGDAERTRAALRDGFFVTGDLGHFDADGFLTIAGRLSRFSKIGGEMVPHGVIEQKVIEGFGLEPGEFPAVVVLGFPDAAKGELLVLLASFALTPESLRAALVQAGLPNLWIPRRIAHVDRIPVLGSGKTDLRACRELARAAAASAGSGPP
jgi:acyl-[acyl-carrier-protein]-phospholipid O-acyltransferase/long-chain-fatty-acid--[acyl-carrier-protein] ligase